MPRRSSTATASDELSPEKLLDKVNDRWPGAVVLGNDPSLRITRIPTGILTLDVLLGGGFPRGRHVEVYGPYSTGKTTIAYHLMAQAQQLGGNAAFVDAEGSFDPEFAADQGVDVDRLPVHRQEHGNRCINFMETLLRAGRWDVICLDSIASLLPKSEWEGDIEDASMGTAQAKLMSAALRKLTAANRNTVLVYINQTREAIGVIFGKRSITTGGKAMGFYAGTRLELAKIENIKAKGAKFDHVKQEDKEADVIRGHRVLVRVDKDKTGGARQHDETTFVFDYKLGTIDRIEDLIYLGRRLKLIKKNGQRWWLVGYEDEAQQGRSKMKSWLRKNRAVQEDLEQMIWQAARETATV